MDFRLALLGKRPRRDPEALVRLRRHLADRIIADGYLNRTRYVELLGRADIVVSTAIHEFQGISLLEACSAGVCPLVPDDLCYREQYPDPFRYAPDQPKALVDRLRTWLDSGVPAPPDVSAWLLPATGKRWQTCLEQALSR
jgi:hypothetical protein